MAGSYYHLLPLEDENEEGLGGWSMIENMGDAYECVEELFWLVEAKIGRKKAVEALEIFYAMKRGAIDKDEHLRFVERHMKL